MTTSTAPTPCATGTVSQARRPWALRLYRAVYRIRDNEAVNCPAPPQSPPGEDTLALAAAIKRAANRLKADGIDPATGTVRYADLPGSESFTELAQRAHDLHRLDLQRLAAASANARKAFWLNLYNVLIVHAVVVYQPRQRITEIGGVFERAAYIVGGWRFSADDIEHGILRANAGHPFLPGPRFGRHDPRRALALPHTDPRLHFALNCAAASCPPISFFDHDRIDDQLDLATRSFVNSGGVQIDRDARTVRLSQLLSWYAGDFGGSLWRRRYAPVLRWLVPYVNDAADQSFLHQHADRIAVQFEPYDWSLPR